MEKLILILSLALSATCFANQDELAAQRKTCADLGTGMKLSQACVSNPQPTDAAEAKSVFKTVSVCTYGSTASSVRMIFSDGGATLLDHYGAGKLLIPGTFTYFTDRYAIMVSTTSKPGEEAPATFIVRHSPANFKSSYTCVHE
jgi:hypothetical protein